MKNALVTIIIPVYNVEKYLDECMESVLNQEYSNLEIILVDDGSTDSSGEMCEQYKKKDERIKVIHKKNGGLSSARNTALDVMTGEFLFFLDSDDYIDKETISTLVMNIVETDADIIECAFGHVYDERIVCRSERNDIVCYSTEQAIQHDLGALNGGSVSSCAKLYRKEVFSNYRFREGRLNEDHFSIVDILLKAGKVVINPQPLYFYRHRRNSITTTAFKESSFDDLEAAKYNYNLIEKIYPGILDVAEFRILFSTWKIIDKIMLSSDWKQNKHLSKLVKDIRANSIKILSCKYFTAKRKLAILPLLVNLRLYRWLVKRNAKKSWTA